MKRDWRILSALEKWGVLGLGQLDGLLFHKDMEPHERVHFLFNGASKDAYRGAGYKGMIRLERAGYVQTHRFVNLPKIYTLAAKGHKALRDALSNRLLDFRDGIAASLVLHELAANGVGMVLGCLLGLEVSSQLERSSLHWATASASSEKVAFPDLWIEDPFRPKAIEVERTIKSSGRYRAIWDSYRQRFPRHTAVLYITTWPHGPKAILTQARKNMADFIYVCSLKNFQASLGTLPWVNYRGEKIVLEKSPNPPQNLEAERLDAGLVIPKK